MVAIIRVAWVGHANGILLLLGKEIGANVLV
jgi:hypothetical protein